MGNSAGKLDQADLEIYQLLTYFNKVKRTQTIIEQNSEHSKTELRTK